MDTHNALNLLILPMFLGTILILASLATLRALQVGVGLVVGAVRRAPLPVDGRPDRWRRRAAGISRRNQGVSGCRA